MRSNAKEVIKKLQARLAAVQKEAPMVLANAGQNFFLREYRKQAWNNVPWKPRAKGNKSRQPLLVGKTRRLLNSVNRSIVSANTKRIVWGSSVPYAAIHNYGGTIHKDAHTMTVGFRKKRGGDQYVFAKIGAKKKKAKFTQTFHIAAQDIQMPKRKFMGVNKGLKMVLTSKYTQMFRGWRK